MYSKTKLWNPRYDVTRRKLDGFSLDSRHSRIAQANLETERGGATGPGHYTYVDETETIV